MSERLYIVKIGERYEQVVSAYDARAAAKKLQGYWKYQGYRVEVVVHGTGEVVAEECWR